MSSIREQKFNRLKKYQALRWMRWILALAGCGLAGYFFWKERTSLLRALSINPIVVVSIFVLTAVYFAFQAYRYLVVINKCTAEKVPYLGWFRVFVLGLFLNRFIPQAGNLYRGVVLKRDYKVSYTDYLTSYISFIWMEICLNFFLALVVVVSTTPYLRIWSWPAWFFLSIMMTGIMILPFVFIGFFHVFRPRTQKLEWIRRKLREVFQTTVKNLRDLKYVFVVVVLGIFAFGQHATLHYICFIAFGYSLSLSALALFYALHKLSSNFSITPGNLGIRELAYGVLSHALGIGMAEGIMISAVLRVLVYITVIVMALPMGGFSLLTSRERTKADDLSAQV